MKILSIILGVALALAFGGIFMVRKDAEELRRQNAALRDEIRNLKEQNAITIANQSKQRDYDLQKLRTEAQDVIRLRNEITQMRSSTKEAERLRAENEKLRNENKEAKAAVAAPAEAPAGTKPEIGRDLFPKETWTFAGYDSPEAAMVSAIWAMKEGNPRVYYESLTPEEQQRQVKNWEGKTEEEIAAKHVSDAAKISSLNITGRQVVSDSEVWMTVAAPGPDGSSRTMAVPMYLVDGSWKFGGFQRPAKAPGAAGR